MGDFIPMDEVISILGDLKIRLRQIFRIRDSANFILTRLMALSDFAEMKKTEPLWVRITSVAIMSITGATSYKHPGSLYLRKKAGYFIDP